MHEWLEIRLEQGQRLPVMSAFALDELGLHSWGITHDDEQSTIVGQGLDKARIEGLTLFQTGLVI